MSSDRKIYKPRPVTGFPEWLPEIRLIEQQWFDHIRKIFESYGFCSIETPSVEELDVLRAKGEVDKEIYVIERLHKEEPTLTNSGLNQQDLKKIHEKEARLALHFDQTVPLARYVAQNFNELVFPFKRYQMQRVWRGERPQAGRFREFYQCDIDVIGIDNLPLHFDAEMPAIIWEILAALPGMENEKIQMQISNRKILSSLIETYTSSSSFPDAKQRAMTAIDKMEKIGEDAVRKELEACGFQQDRISYLLPLIKKKYTQADELEELRSFEGLAGNMTYHQGIDELKFVLSNLSHLPKDAVVADLSIVRGLDYYTGTVYETRFLDDPTYGSICSGGRYDDLAGSYINKHLPGVGISIGFSRLFERILKKGHLPAGPKSPAHVMVILPSEEGRASASATAQQLRKRGLNVELFHAAKKIPDQLKYASRKGIPYVWFPDLDEVKDMASGEQGPANPETWSPNEK